MSASGAVAGAIAAPARRRTAAPRPRPDPNAAAVDAAGDVHGESLPYLLNRVVARLNAPMQQELARRGLTMTHWRVLGFLSERDGLVVGELAERTITDQATLSRALMRLEERGLLERVAGEADSRFVEIHLLEAGRALYREVLAFAHRVEAWAFDEMSAGEMRALRRALEKLNRGLSARTFRPDEGGSR